VTPADHADTARVAELLGREPQCDFEVVVRDAEGDPVVIRNAPFLHDGTPMPTRYWLAGRDLLRRVSRIEADGGVRRAEAEVPADEIVAAHARYAADRDAAIPADHTGPRPSAGVGGTREGVKCLHAHLAFHLAGGDDAVGRWVAALLDAEDGPSARVPDQPTTTARPQDVTPDVVVLEARRTVLRVGSIEWSMPVGTATLDDLLESDPPRANELTNAIGWFADHLDDALREHPHLELVDEWHLDGAATLAHVEAGRVVTLPCTLERGAIEEVFRTVVTEHSTDRAANPGLPADEVVTVMGLACAVVSFLRRMACDSVTIRS
jgi:hypothetical protein